MADITVISGSTLGGAEYVAEHLAELLEQAGFSTETLHGPELNELPNNGLWLVVTSTHGAGDLPDNLQPLFKQLEQQKPDLSQVRFGAVGIGSREYDTFCGAILTADRTLTQLGAQRIGELLQIDITKHEIPEDPAEEWLGSWVVLFK
ncbi:FMN-binding protein MioC [Pectobacterium sp. B1J-3]|uniref:FMN-binding protein MioC n=1 Tax=Pectobacterium sp. B1J-3 TaxID=3385371 RepID=UPI0039067B08